MNLTENNREDGLLLNLTGYGKGKTTGALGIVVRALGWGWKVAVLQFMKGERDTGERCFFRDHFPGMIFEQHGLGLLSRPGDHAGMAFQGWRRAQQLLRDFDGDLLVLDELNNALAYGFIDQEAVVSALAQRRSGLNVVVTGRDAPETLRKSSDLVSEIADVKHPYHRGVPARQGIDY